MPSTVETYVHSGVKLTSSIAMSPTRFKNKCILIFRCKHLTMSRNTNRCLYYDLDLFYYVFELNLCFNLEEEEEE